MPYVALVLCGVFTFSCCMLVCIFSRASRVRLPRVALRSSAPPFIYSSSQRRAPSSTPAALHVGPAMFQRALQSHAAAESPKMQIGKQLFPSSASADSPNAQSTFPSPCRPLTQQGSHRPLLNHGLRPTQPSTLNTIEGRSPLFANTAVKRTSAGLAKALGNNGQDAFLEQQRFSNISVSTVNKTVPTTKRSSTKDSVVVFEDDFDSDIDLEEEHPTSKDSVAYPKLSTTYPALQKKAHLHTQSYLDSGSNAVAPCAEDLPPSTQLYQWSSTPDYHFEKPAQSVRLSGPADCNQTLSNIRSDRGSRVEPDLADAERSDRPPKRRTLPWLQRQTEENESASHNLKTPAKAMAPLSVQAEPQSSKYIWNATASAIKEQQKQFRKTHKKTLKSELAADDGPIKIQAGTKKSKGVSRPHLSKEQHQVLDLVVEGGKSVFFTGSAGTGKSVLLREIIAVLRKKFQRESDRVAITASTGLAACNVGGVTLHSFAGIGLGKEEVPDLVKKIKRNQKAKHRWMRTKVLIVDEVSMVDGDLFDKLEAIARQIRNNGRPFGGIQLVITGDFFQLPPVPDYSSRLSTFAFEAKSWSSAIDHTIGLNHVFRQRDPVFANMLNEMREGRLSQASIKTFRDLSRPILIKDDDGDCEATELFPTRAEVDAANNTRMRQLSGATMRFEARDGGMVTDSTARDKLLSNCMAPQDLVLKKGAQVMLIKNIDENLVNGSLGKVLGFMNEEMFNSYNADPDLFTGTAEVDGDEDLNPQQKKEKLKFEILKGSTSQCWPVVRFVNADGTTRDLLCNREIWKVELPNGEIQASRAQVPLILAWALSIHKAQGQTLEKVKVDLGKVFEKGQAYVALSRATCIEGLQVLRFDPAKVMAHDRVRNFYSGLSRAEGFGHA